LGSAPLADPRWDTELFNRFWSAVENPEEGEDDPNGTFCVERIARRYGIGDAQVTKCLAGLRGRVSHEEFLDVELGLVILGDWCEDVAKSIEFDRRRRWRERMERVK
jgi:hypothetical protein